MGMATIVAARAAGSARIIVIGTSKDRFRFDLAVGDGVAYREMFEKRS